MASVIQPLAMSGSRKPDGSVNAGGRVFLSLIDAPNSPVIGYGDRDASAAIPLNGGGYMLDVSGKAAIFVNNPCRVRIEDTAGVLVDSFTYEPTVNAGLVEVLQTGFSGLDPNTGQLVNGSRTYLKNVLDNIAASLGGIDGKYLGPVSGGTSRNLRDAIAAMAITPQDFAGTIPAASLGNDNNDATSAIQSAINYAAANGKYLLIPPGIYRISSVLNVPTVVVIQGAGAGTTIKQMNTSLGVFTGFLSNVAGQVGAIRDMVLDTAGANSSTAIAITGPWSLIGLTVQSSFLSGITKGGNGNLFVDNCRVSGAAGAGSKAIAITSGIGVAAISRCVLSGSETAISSASASLLVSESSVSGTTTSIAITSGSLEMSSSVSGAITVGASVSNVDISGGNTITGTVTDSRTGAPVSYSLATSSAVTPLPLQSSAIRIVATAAITATISPVAATGFGKKFSLKCINNSGGAVTWTFDAQYKLSAAVAPATGNQVNLLLEYDPIADKTYELGRAATAI